MAVASMAAVLLTGLAVATAILLLGLLFLWILRTPKFQFSLSFMMLTTTCLVFAIGLWTFLLRGLGPFPEPAMQRPAGQPAAKPHSPTDKDKEEENLDPPQLEQLEPKE